MIDITDKLKSYFEKKKITQAQIAKELDVTKAYVNSLFTGKRPFGKKQAQIWEDRYGLSKAWLLTGEGEMLKTEKNSEKNTGENIEDELPQAEEAFPDMDNVNILVSQHPDSPRMIPFYDADTTGGYNGHVSSSNTPVTLKGYIYAGDWFAGRETAAIRHVGDSMIEYPDGCVLAVKEVKELRLLVPGRNYVIETDEYRVTKRIQKGHSKDCIALYSSNQEKYEDGRLRHEPFEVMLCDVRRIYSILGYIVNQSGEARLITP